MFKGFSVLCNIRLAIFGQSEALQSWEAILFYSQEPSYEKGRQISGGVFTENTIITILAKELMVKRKGTSVLINIINLSLQMFR